MQILINDSDGQNSPAIEKHVTEKVTAALKRWADQVTRVEVHLHDENAHKAGNDKHVKMEVRLTHHQPMIVEDVADDLYNAITHAAKKLSTLVQRKLEKLDRT
ncbi:MAG: ribosome-associated translation inhibitor RaiA [Planctomycetes bacterium]|nr:ribosome-associated translation inhibitor RaiA [Planctomycetota bacterium]